MTTKSSTDKTTDLCLPSGFRYAGIACGIKESGDPDLALIVSDQPCTAAGVYTQNIVRAACIEWNEAITPGLAKSVVINSGNANACTGQTGQKNVEDTAKKVAQVCSDESAAVECGDVLVLSTGIIGVQLPMEYLQSGIVRAAAELSNDADAFYVAADAICTSDNARKTTCRSLTVDGQSYSMAAMAKGAGMIGPRMATMLCVVTCDYPLSVETAQSMLLTAANHSFNRISVEGHTSTNDAVILLCPPPAVDSNEDPQAIAEVSQALNSCCLELAKMIPADGEGATHLIEVSVSGADDDSIADQIARIVASSNLVKTAITGADPNWGRIVSAIGILDVQVAIEDVSLSLNGFTVFEAGQPAEFDAQQVSADMAANFETKIELVVGQGMGKSLHWTSDLTVDYVRFNSEYTT